MNAVTEPLNAEGRRLAEAWDPARDEAAGEEPPERLRIARGGILVHGVRPHPLDETDPLDQLAQLARGDRGHDVGAELLPRQRHVYLEQVEAAKEYIRLNRVFRELGPDDTVLVIGTSGQVINTDALLFDKPSYKVLNNLGPEPGIDANIYDSVNYGRAADVCDALDQI